MFSLGYISWSQGQTKENLIRGPEICVACRNHFSRKPNLINLRKFLAWYVVNKILSSGSCNVCVILTTVQKAPDVGKSEFWISKQLTCAISFIILGLSPASTNIFGTITFGHSCYLLSSCSMLDTVQSPLHA